jgi:outer membrane lipoprotein-sorting protein
MKKLVTLTAAFLLCVSLAGAQDAAAIMDAARNRVSSKSMGSQNRMVITAKNGTTSERLINQYSKDDQNGNSRTMIEFGSPASVKGTRFLTMDRGNGTSDQWIYLPALRKTRRIQSGEGGGSFMGTDFSYDDISLTSRDSADDTHTLLRQESLNGNACYVIQSVPKGDFQYSKTITWVDTAKSFIYKIELYDKKGALVKVLEMSNFQNRQGRDTPLDMKISTVAAGTSTTIRMTKVEYDMNIPESLFSTRYLETGRP